MEEDDLRKYHKMKACAECRAAMLTFFTEARQADGTWKLVKVSRNCGHVSDSDPQ